MPASRKKPDPEQGLRAARDRRSIEAYRSGRGEAFEELVVAYDAHVRRQLAQLNAPLPEIDDLSQEVFLRVFRNLSRFRGQSSFYTWLYRITVNVFFDHSKKRKRADVRLQRLQNALIDVSAPRNHDADPYHACYEALTQDALARAIAALPEAFRDVVTMREVEDLSYEEIAAQTGVTLGTVRSRLSRARMRLKELLRPVVSEAA